MPRPGTAPAPDVEDDPAARADEVVRSCLGMRVTRLHRVVARAYDQALHPLGLTLPQLEVLTALTLADGPVTPSELAGRFSLERSTLSRNLALLEGRGWVSAAQVSATGRSMAVVLTAEGAGVLATAESAWRGAQQAMTDALGTGAVDVLDRWLEDVAAAPRVPA